MPRISASGLTVTVDTSSLQDVTATQGTFSDRVQVTVSSKTTKITGVAATGGLVDGGWISGHTDGLNITPNDDGISGKKLVLGYFDGSVYRSAIEYASTTGGALTSVVVTPPASFTGGVITSTLRISGGPTTKASTATGSPGEFTWDGSFLYVCVATDTWRRVATIGGY